MGDIALGLRFKVSIDGQDFGNWQKCDGLSIQYDTVEYQEGGENGFVHRLPGRAKFETIKLTRPIDQHTARVSLWVQSVQIRPLPGTGHVAVMDATGSSVADWYLIGVYPVRWSGPTLDIDGNQQATETLELSHNGFAGPF
jgi:phage tail-like protein